MSQPPPTTGAPESACPRCETVFHARLSDGQLWPFSAEDVRRGRINAYEFGEIVWSGQHNLTADEVLTVQARLR